MSIKIYTYSNPYELKREEFWSTLKECPQLCVSQTMVNGLESAYPELRRNMVTFWRFLNELYNNWEDRNTRVRQMMEVDNAIHLMPIDGDNRENIKRSLEYNSKDLASCIRLFSELDMSPDHFDTSLMNIDQKYLVEIYRIIYGRERSSFRFDRSLEEDKIDKKALYKIGYGLYVATCHDGKKANGQIVNTVSQVASDPAKIAVNLVKSNYTAEVVRKTGVLNVCVLNEECPFQIFKHFGFQSGRDVDKFADFDHYDVATNGVPYLNKYANGYMCLKVFDTVDMGSHWMFLCDITEAAVINNVETMTYSFYQKNVKPKPQEEVKGWVCEICGYVYEGDELPEDFICPLCKHPASDFKKMG